MFEKKLKRRNVIFNILIFAGFALGARTAINYLAFIMNFDSVNGEQIGSVSSNMVVYYMMFFGCSVAAIVFSFLTKRGVKKVYYYIRTGLLIVSSFLIIMSSTAITVMGSIGIARFYEDFDTLKELYASELVDMLLEEPFSFYTYIIADVIFFVLMMINFTFWLVKKRKPYFDVRT